MACGDVRGVLFLVLAFHDGDYPQAPRSGLIDKGLVHPNLCFGSLGEHPGLCISCARAAPAAGPALAWLLRSKVFCQQLRRFFLSPLLLLLLLLGVCITALERRAQIAPGSGQIHGMCLLTEQMMLLLSAAFVFLLFKEKVFLFPVMDSCHQPLLPAWGWSCLCTALPMWGGEFIPAMFQSKAGMEADVC